MGLKEKQAIKSVTESFDYYQKGIKERLNKDIAITLDESSFSNDYDALMMVENQGAAYVNNGIAKICQDAIGKEALNDKKIEKILLVNHKTKGEKKLVFNGSTLELHGTWGEERDYLSEMEVREALENQL